MALKVNYLPFFRDLKSYNLSFFRGDLIAALSVALMALPQAIAYAFVAGLPISTGIFSAIFGTILTSAFGSSPRLVSGPTNTVAILIQSGTAEILYTYYAGIEGAARDTLALQIVLQLSLIVGLFQIIGGLLKWGRVTQFASRPVIIGYTAGAALAIVVSQLYYFFGVAKVERALPLYQEAIFFLSHLKFLHGPTTLIGIFSLLLLIVFHKTSQKIPGALIVLFLASLVVYLFHLSPDSFPSLFDLSPGEKSAKVTLLHDVGPLPAALPTISVPFFNFRILTKLIPLAFAIALLSVVEVTAIARAYTTSKDAPYNDNTQVLGLGFSNFFSSFFGAMPSSGSFSRTALNEATGAKTRFAPIFSGLFVLLLIIVFQSLVTKVPLTALAALMLLTAYTMVNFKDLFVCVKSQLSDATVLIVTFVSSLIFTLDVALYIGVALSIAVFLKHASKPSFVEYTFTPAGKLRFLESEDLRPDPRIAIIQAEGGLFFGSIDLFQTKIRQLAEEENIHVIILQAINEKYIDASACLALKQLNDYLSNKGILFLMSAVTPEVEKVLRSSSVISAMGEEHFFKADFETPSKATRDAYAEAKRHLTGLDRLSSQAPRSL